MKQGLTLPYPSGPHWNNLLSNKVAQKPYAHGLHEDDVEEEQTYYSRLVFEKTCSYESPEGELRTSMDVSEPHVLQWSAVRYSPLSLMS